MKPAMIILFAVSILCAEDSIMAIIKKSPGCEDYPQAGAIILFERITDRYSTREKVREVHLLIKMLNDRGIDEYGDQKVEYDKSSEEVEIVEARTITPDLKVVKPLKTAISDVSAVSVAEAPAYANRMVKVVSFPAMEKNAVIEYHFRIRGKSKSGIKFIWGSEFFQYPEPMLEKNFRLIVPDKFEIKHKIVGSEVEYHQSTANGQKIYSWVKRNSEQIILEESMPPLEAVATKLIYSSAHNWQETGKWFKEKFYKRFKIDKRLKGELTQLIKPDDTYSEKVKKIALFVVSKIRSIYLDPAISGYTPLSPSAILKNRYGISLDKTMLLVSLLRAAGIESYPALGNNGDYEIIPEIPSLEQFNDVWVVVKDGEKMRWIDPTAENCGYDFFPPSQQARLAMVVMEDSSFLTKTVYHQPEMSRSQLRLVLSVDKSGNLEGEASYELRGYPEILSRSSLKDKNERERQIYFATGLNHLGYGASVKRYETANLKNLDEPAWVNYSFTVPDYAVTQGNMMIVKIPLFNFSFSLTGYFPSLIQRKYDYLFPADYQRIEDIEIKFPHGYRAVYLPGSITDTNRYFNFRIDCACDTNIVHFYRTISVRNRHILISDYPNFKERFERFTDPKNSLIILKRY